MFRRRVSARAGRGLMAALLMIGMTGTAGAQSSDAVRRARAARATPRLIELTALLQSSADLQTASERRALILQMMEDDPGAVLGLALSAAARAALPADARALVEFQTDVQGDIEVLYEDYDAGARLRRFLHTPGGRLEVHFASEPADMTSGDRVRVRGVRLDRSLAADGASATVVQAVSALPDTLGEQRALMILVNFQDKPTQQPYTVATAYNLLFGSVDSFDRENSQDQAWLAGDVAGWFTIPVSSTVCDTSAIRTAAQQAAANAGFSLAAYKRFVYAFPSTSACAWWGLGQVGGSPTHAWINGSLATRVVAHELGHNLGVYHARALECGSTTLGDNCSTIEYGDPADIMGMSGVVAHFNAFQKERMGWLNYGRSLPILTVQGDGTFLIEPYAAPGIGPKALKILKSIDPNTGKRTWYYVEYRRGGGFDGGLSGNANLANGVVVHTGSEATPNSSYVLDMTPETSSWTDPALVAGRWFTDPAAGVTITTLSTGTSGAMVQVQLGSQACVPSTPTMSVTSAVSQMAVPGATASYALLVRNNDGPSCATPVFALAATLPAGWSYSMTPASLSLVPGASTSATLNVTSSAGAVENVYGINATATNTASGQAALVSVNYSVLGSLNIVLTSDRASYGGNQNVKLASLVTAGLQPLAGATTTFVITGPTGSRVSASATTAADGTATYQMRIKPKDPLGVYVVDATAGAGGRSASARLTFVVQ